MSINVTLTGMAELQTLLRSLPSHLADKAAPIVFAHADAAAAAITDAYPVSDERHRHLRDGVSVTKEGNAASGVLAIVRNRHPLAHIYEFGTVERATKKGWKRGAMKVAPPAHAFIPRAIQFRRRMYEAIKAMLRDEGFQVSGSAE